MKVMTTLDWIAWSLVIIGAINWGLVGLLQFDLVSFLFGTLSALTRIIYSLVGIAAIYVLISGLRARLIVT